VRTARVRGKVKRMGRFVGKRPNWKKAWVRLTPDSGEIEFFEAT
jgi:large subunit ribosomal protein L23